MVITGLIRVALVIERDRSKSTCGKRSILLRIVHVVDQILHRLGRASPSARGPGLGSGRGCAERRSLRPLMMLDAAILVIGRAGPFRGHHQGAERRLGRACRPEDLALPGLHGALERLAALAGFWIGDLEIGYGELSFGVEAGVFDAQPDAGMIDRSQASPFEEFTQCIDARDGARRRRIRSPERRGRIDFRSPRAPL